MARRVGSGGGGGGAAGGSGSGFATARQLAKRGIPVAMELYRRWQSLTPEQRERYLRMAREYADRATDAYSKRRSSQYGGRGRGFRR